MNKQSMSGNDSITEEWNPSEIVSSPRMVPQEEDLNLSDTSGIYFGPPTVKPSESNTSLNDHHENTFQKSETETSVDINPLIKDAAEARSPYALRPRSSLTETSSEVSECSFQDSGSQTEHQPQTAKAIKRKSSGLGSQRKNKTPKVENKSKNPKQNALKQKNANKESTAEKKRNPPKRQRIWGHRKEQQAQPIDEEREIKSPATPLQTIPEDDIIKNQRYVINLNVHIPESSSNEDVILRAELLHSVPTDLVKLQNEDNIEKQAIDYSQASTSGTQTQPIQQLEYLENQKNANSSDETGINELDYLKSVNNTATSNETNVEAKECQPKTDGIQENIEPDETDLILVKADVGVQTESCSAQIKIEPVTPPCQKYSLEYPTKLKIEKKKKYVKKAPRKKMDKLPRIINLDTSDSFSSGSSCSCSDCEYSTTCSCSSCQSSYYTSDSYSD